MATNVNLTALGESVTPIDRALPAAGPRLGGHGTGPAHALGLRTYRLKEDRPADQKRFQASKGQVRTGAPPGTRTPNPRIKSLLLCQLS
jgi:hypothetical protein